MRQVVTRLASEQSLCHGARGCSQPESGWQGFVWMVLQGSDWIVQIPRAPQCAAAFIRLVKFMCNQEELVDKCTWIFYQVGI